MAYQVLILPVIGVLVAILLINKFRRPRVRCDFGWGDSNKSRFQFYKELYENRPNDNNGVLIYEKNSKNASVVQPRLVTEVLNKCLSRPRTSYNEMNNLTHSIFNLNGRVWEEQRRRLGREAFNSQMITKLSATIEECARLTVCDLGKSPSLIADGMNVASQFVARSLYRCVFGKTSEEGLHEFTAMSKKLRNLETDSFMNGCPFFNQRGGDSIASDYFRRLIKTQMDQMNTNCSGDCFLRAFVEMLDGENHWDVSAIQSHCVVFLFGGYTATVSTVAFVMNELAKNEKIQEKLFDEITMSQPYNDTYLKCVVKETLRKYPPFAANERTCHQDVRLSSGQELKAGTSVIIPVSGIHHDPQYFEDPESFIPERFDPSSRDLANHAYWPFGGGRRKCIGEKFAMALINVFIRRIVSMYTITSTGSENILKFQPGKFTTKPFDIELKFVQRLNQ